MYAEDKFLIAKNDDTNLFMLPKLVNRHGLIAGATGTGKTITLEVIAGSLSEAGVPVFLADIKGDISGMAKSGEGNDKLMAHIEKMGIKDFPFHAYPVSFWDVYEKMGHPVRTTISDMGPVLLGRLLGLTDVQEGVLNIAFKVADDKKLLLIDLKDLKSVLQYVGDNAKELTTQYGNASKQSVGAILRALIALEDAGADSFFGEPNLQVSDWMTKDANGKGMVNILHCVELFQKPILYSTFMLWLLSEIYETLPEVGDLDKPKMVFFFDEAHLLFKDAPKVMVDKVEQVVKLIRSKGVGVYFISQNPSDIPDSVLSQLGNRVQHALRGYTPADQKSIKAAADSFRPNPKFKTTDAITDLGTGEALVSFLDEEGKPTIVERAKILPPSNMMKALDDETRYQIIKESGLYGKYENAVDRESAYEILSTQKAKDDQAAQEAQAAAEQAKKMKEEAKAAEALARAQRRQPKSFGERIADKAINSLEQQAIRSFTRGIMGLFKK